MWKWLFVQMLLLSVPALADQAPPIVVDPGAVPPQFAPPPPPPSLPSAVPLSMKLLQLRAPTMFESTFRVERSGITLVDSRYGTGLDLAVTGSERAVALAREAHTDLVTGHALVYTGVGIEIASLLSELSYTLTLSSTNQQFPDFWFFAALGGVVVGLIVTLIGAPYLSSGLREEFEAVSAYNADLVDGRLTPPSANALPAR